MPLGARRARVRRSAAAGTDTPARAYQSWLLRLWRQAPERPAAWRASLENTRTGERLGFADLERLFVYLLEQTQDGRDVPRGARRAAADDGVPPLWEDPDPYA